MGSGARPETGVGRRGRRWGGLVAGAWLVGAPPVAAASHPVDPVIREVDIEEISELNLEALLSAPTVESASKRRQSLEEAPGAITVIEGRELAEAGAVSLADALRLVPGLWVFQTD